MARGIGGHSPANMQKYLKGQYYPARKDDLLQTAQYNKAPQEVLDMINNYQRTISVDRRT